MLKNTSMRILEDSRIVRFFGHRGPLGKISFLANFFKVYSVGLMHIFGVLRSVGCSKIVLCKEVLRNFSAITPCC